MEGMIFKFNSRRCERRLLENIIFFKFNSRRCERRSLEKINNRRSECRTLKICFCHSVSKRTSLIIFLKPSEFGFLFLKTLLPYKTPLFLSQLFVVAPVPSSKCTSETFVFYCSLTL